MTDELRGTVLLLLLVATGLWSLLWTWDGLTPVDYRTLPEVRPAVVATQVEMADTSSTSFAIYGTLTASAIPSSILVGDPSNAFMVITTDDLTIMNGTGTASTLLKIRETKRDER